MAKDHPYQIPAITPILFSCERETAWDEHERRLRHRQTVEPNPYPPPGMDDIEEVSRRTRERISRWLSDEMEDEVEVTTLRGDNRIIRQVVQHRGVQFGLEDVKLDLVRPGRCDYCGVGYGPDEGKTCSCCGAPVKPGYVRRQS